MICVRPRCQVPGSCHDAGRCLYPIRLLELVEDPGAQAWTVRAEINGQIRVLTWAGDRLCGGQLSDDTRMALTKIIEREIIRRRDDREA